MGEKKRIIYTFETRFHRLQNNMMHSFWDPNIIEAIFDELIARPKAELVEDKKDEWFFYLASVSKNKESISGNEPYIFGWFEWVRLGLRTDLLRTDLLSRSTLEPRENPKGPDESEVNRTYFYFRLRDGLFLLDRTFGSIITANKITTYIENKCKELLERNGIKYVSLSHFIAQGFLEELTKFDSVRLAQIRLRVSEKKHYDESDAIGFLQEKSRISNANYIELTVGRKNARKHGLIVENLKNLLMKLMQNSEDVIAGVIEGSRSDGGPPRLTLRGIDEKFPSKFKTDLYGEVLKEHMFEYMIEIGNHHY